MTLRGGQKGKENDQSAISKCIISVQVGDRRLCTESCWVTVLGVDERGKGE
jgi:hypothetical protein